MNYEDEDNKDCCQIDKEKGEEEEERLTVTEFLRKQVEGWDDNVKAAAWYKGFSGQRSDWEGRYLFWRDLILKVARHLRTFIIRPSRLKNSWFCRDGALSPLCLDHVLFEMYKAGDLLPSSELVDPRTKRLSSILWKTVRVLGFSRPLSPDNFTEDYYILSTLLKEKAIEVVKIMSENHWTSSCVLTLRKFQEICGGQKEASAVFSYLSGCGEAKYLVIDKKDIVEGVKVSLSPGTVSSATSLDYDILHLIWTAEKLEQQLDVIDHRCQKSKMSAVASLKSGNKQVALRHARELRLASQSREKCRIYLNRVEEVLGVITDFESSEKVSEAIKIGAQAIKGNRISVEEIEDCLEELDLSFNSMKQVDEALGSAPACSEVEEDIEDELKVLELEIGAGPVQIPEGKSGGNCPVGVLEALETADSLTDTLSKLNLKGSAATEAIEKKRFEESTSEVSRDANRECA